MNTVRIIKTLTHVLLTVVIILYIITGFGITNYHLIETLTFGALSKPTSFQLHTSLIIPFFILLGLHLFFTMKKKGVVFFKKISKK